MRRLVRCYLLVELSNADESIAFETGDLYAALAGNLQRSQRQSQRQVLVTDLPVFVFILILVHLLAYRGLCSTLTPFLRRVLNEAVIVLVHVILRSLRHGGRQDSVGRSITRRNGRVTTFRCQIEGEDSEVRPRRRVRTR